MHKSYFETGHSVEDFIFKGLNVSSIEGFVGLWFFILILTILHEALRAFRQRLSNFLLGTSPSSRIPSQTSTAHEDNATSEIPGRNEKTFLVHVGRTSPRQIYRIKFHALNSALYTVQLFLAYILMMVVMSYNAWLLLAVLLGAGMAHLVLGLTSLSSNTMLATPDSSHCDNGH